MSRDACVRRGVTVATDAATAAAELHAGLLQPGIALVLFFVSPAHDLDRLAAALAGRFGPVPVFGCTTAGEIAPQGYVTGAIVGVSLAAPDFACAGVLIKGVATSSLPRVQEAVQRARAEIAAAAPWARPEHMFAVTLIDGLSGCEEMLASALYAALAGVPLCGGSAGDALSFARTYILHAGRFRSDCAALILVATRRRFRVFKTEHFAAGRHKVVVTAADPARRVVTELDAEPAAEEYARIAGLEPAALTPRVFATHPMVVRVAGQNFVRSIQRANDDGSLRFFCAIDEGIVLTVAHGMDLVRDLEERFRALRRELGLPALVLGFDCILRALEMDERDQRAATGAVMARNNVIGFCTYGEQYDAMHVNQTLSGVAIAGALPA